jgi:hypothetical protein
VAGGGLTCGVTEEARTRGFAAPAFAGCAFVEEWPYTRKRYETCQLRPAVWDLFAAAERLDLEGIAAKGGRPPA